MTFDALSTAEKIIEKFIATTTNPYGLSVGRALGFRTGVVQVKAVLQQKEKVGFVHGVQGFMAEALFDQIDVINRMRQA